MQQGWEERYGDLVALLRKSITDSGMAAPKGGVRMEAVHPFPTSYVKRRRRHAQDSWDQFDAAMQRYVQQGKE